MQSANLRQGASRYLALAGLGLALLAGTVEILAGPGTRLGLWNYRVGIMLFWTAGIAGMAGAALSLGAGIVAGPRSPAVRMAVAGVIIGLVAAGIPWTWYRVAEHVPRIHDITTDTIDPPAFSAVLPFRRGAENPAAYGGPAIAAQQERSYPDIRPLALPLTPAGAFDRALSVARARGWDIVSADPAKGRIEATATTFWFGFKDDIVVRIAPTGDGATIDVRSASRVGLSDLGANAERVRTFLADMKSAP